MKLYTAGPVQMDSETLQLSGLQLPYFRTSDFSQVMLTCDEILKGLLKTARNSKTMYLTASGTAAMEAAVVNIFNEDDKVLVINGGTFGKRFEQLCLEIYGIPHVSLELPFGTAFTKELLDKYKNQKFTGLLVNIHESTTGQLYDLKVISEFCKSQGMCLVVDAISSFLIDEFEMDANNIDATIISSHKGLGLAPGISMLVVNDKTYCNKIKNNKPRCLYLRFEDYVRDISRGQTPYTPAVGIIMQLHEKLLRIKSLGIDSVVSHIRDLAVHFRNEARRLGFVFPEYNLSNGITPIIRENRDAKIIVGKLIEKFDVYVLPNGGDLADKVFRVGHMSLDLKLKDMDFLINCLKEVSS